jgi:hypothetical protein
MKKSWIIVFSLAVCFSSCIKDLIEDQPDPLIEDDTKFLRNFDIFGFPVEASSCDVAECLQNDTDTTKYQYHKSGGLKQVFLNNIGSRVDFVYDTVGRLSYILMYDEGGLDQRLKIFYTTDETKVRRVEYTRYITQGTGVVDTIYMEYPRIGNTIILESTRLKQGNRNEATICTYMPDGQISMIERGLRDDMSGDFQVLQTEYLTYDRNLLNPYYSNAYADMLLLLATMPGVDVQDRQFMFLSRYATESFTPQYSEPSLVLKNKTKDLNGFTSSVSYNRSDGGDHTFQFTYSCK